MILEIEGEPVFIHNGGIPPRPGSTPLVLVHGAGMNHSVFRYQSRALAHSGYSVYAVDLPGHGRSGGEPPSSIQDSAARIVRLIEELDLDPAVLIGHSSGAFVALETAANVPDRVRGLVLIGASDDMAVHPELLEAARAGDHLAVDLMVGWSHTGEARFGSRADPGGWQQGTAARILEENLDHALGVDLAACRSYRPLVSAAKVSAPTLVIVGRSDRMTPPGAGRRLASAIAGAEVAEVPAGHFGLLDEPRRIQAAILDWLTRHAPVT